jgi:hypothetical protein
VKIPFVFSIGDIFIADRILRGQHGSAREVLNWLRLGEFLTQEALGAYVEYSQRPAFRMRVP